MIFLAKSFNLRVFLFSKFTSKVKDYLIVLAKNHQALPASHTACDDQ